jgi:hypothetical protein
MEQLGTTEQINKFIMNDKYMIIAFNSFRNIFVLHKYKDIYFFKGMGWVSQMWSLECDEAGLKEMLFKLPPGVILFDSQLEFMEWAYRITKDGK